MSKNFHNTRPRKVLLINSRPLNEEGVSQILAITRNLPEEWELFAASPMYVEKQEPQKMESGTRPGADTATDAGHSSRNSDSHVEKLRQVLGDEHVFVLPPVPFSPFALYELMRFCWLHGIHLTHSHGTGAGLYARLLKLLVGVPCVHTFPKRGSTTGSRLTVFLGKLYERGTSLLTRKGIALSRDEYEHIVSAGVFPKCKLCCLEDDVDESEAVSWPDSNSEGAESGTGLRVAVHLSKHDNGASSRLLMQVLGALHEAGKAESFNFLVFGGGPGRLELEESLIGAGLTRHVEFAGSQSTLQALRHRLHEAFCYLELGAGRSFGDTALQAMACGLPVLAPDTGVFRHVLENGCNALLYRYGSAASATQALLQLADQPDAAHCLGAGARQLSGGLIRLRDLAERIDGVYRSVALPPVSPDPIDVPPKSRSELR